MKSWGLRGKVSRLKFYIDKIGFLAAFIWYRHWKLVKAEWNLTYKEMKEAEARLPEIEREAIERLLGIIDEHRENNTQA